MTIKIECDKRIKRLNIEFDDDYVDVISETNVRSYATNKKDSYDSNIEKKHKKEKQNKDIGNAPVLNTDDEDETEISKEIVEKPVIEDKERIPNVAQEMQNLEF